MLMRFYVLACLRLCLELIANFALSTRTITSKYTLWATIAYWAPEICMKNMTRCDSSRERN